MNWKTLTGTAVLGVALAATLGIGVLAGSVLTPSASAGTAVTQTDQTGQVADATATPAPDSQKPGSPRNGMPGMRGSRGPGGPGGQAWGGGPGGPDAGPRFESGVRGSFGGAYSADGATRAISSTTSVITLVKGDLAYAAGKMDTATAQDWVDKADGLLAAAQTANTNGEYGKSVETANAASELARAAEMLMQQALGADTLPSYTQRQNAGKGQMHPGMPGPGMGPGKIGPGGQVPSNITQAQASRIVANLYNSIVSQEALVNSSASKGGAATYVAAAKDQYSKAYSAYQAGNYSDAAGAANVGDALLRVVNSLLSAGTAPNSPDTPVQVPQPFS